MQNTSWYILGTGNFAFEVLDWSIDTGLSKQSFLGFLGDPSGAASAALPFPTFHEDSVELTNQVKLVNAISNPAVKRTVIPRLRERHSARFHTIIHPSATVKARDIGEGTLVCPNCVIGPEVVLGEFVTLNYHTGIGHETVISDFVSTAPGVQIGGNSSIASGAYFGMNSTVIDRIKVGEEAIVNAGSVVIGRVQAGKRVSGNPAKKTVTF